MDNQNFQIKQNLLKFKNAFVMNIKGKTASKQCICIPVIDNYVFMSADDNMKAKGAYVDINANQYEGGTSQYGDTHYLRLAVPKEIREKMTEEEKKAIPYLGNMKPSQYQQPQSAEVETATYSVPEDDLDDLPF